eukprot:gene8090-12551_t
MSEETFKKIEQYFDKPLFEAAMALNMTEIEIKTIIKEHGYHRWPYHGFRTLPTKKSKKTPFDVFKLETTNFTVDPTPQRISSTSPKQKRNVNELQVNLPSFNDLMNSVAQNDQKNQKQDSNYQQEQKMNNNK